MLHQFQVENQTGVTITNVTGFHNNDTHKHRTTTAATLGTGDSTPAVDINVDGSGDYFSVVFNIGSTQYNGPSTKCNVHQTGKNTAPTTIEVTQAHWDILCPNSSDCTNISYG